MTSPRGAVGRPRWLLLGAGVAMLALGALLIVTAIQPAVDNRWPILMVGIVTLALAPLIIITALYPVIAGHSFLR